MSSRLPLILEPEALHSNLDSEEVLLVDLRKAEDYAQGHVPGAVHLERDAILAQRPPVGGLLPDDRALSEVLGGIGLSAGRAVVAYDEEGGGWAGRLIWTLHVVGHHEASLLDGGWRAWAAEGYPVSTEPVTPMVTEFRARRGAEALADTDYILQHLGRTDLALLDTRTAEEFSGAKRLAARGGHIPGAINFDWVRAMDEGRNLRLKDAAELRAMLEALGVGPDKEVVVYCQTHHRSSHTYVVLKSLAYPRVRGYPGAWSDWGNRSDTPVEP